MDQLFREERCHRLAGLLLAMSVSHSEEKTCMERELSISALLALGQICLNHGDEERAVSLFETAARSGSAEALNMMGRAYERGWGVRRNSSVAARYFQSAAEKGYGWGMFNLADLYLSGEVGEKNPLIAYGLYVEAARKGVAKALNMLGLLHEDGLSGQLDPKEAETFFHAAAMAGDCWGFVNTGRMHLVRNEIKEASFSFRKALSLGFTDVFRAVKGLLESAPLHPELHALLLESERLLHASSRQAHPLSGNRKPDTHFVISSGVRL